MLQVEIVGLGYDSASFTPVVLLKEIDGERILPIWIGGSEADAIQLMLTGKSFYRPLAHDLMKNIIIGLQAELQRVVIHELKDNTFYAKLCLHKEQISVEIDARPSDSIALALRMKAPLYVADEVMEQGGHHIDIDGNLKEPNSSESLREYLSNLNPEDFGKFEL